MAMLAEKRRRTKFVLHPVAKPLWTSGNNGVQFGKKMMEKMGWSAGKGLGAMEQGIHEPVRAVYKQDNKGMGYSGDGNPFENLDQFNALLSSLSGETHDSEQVHSFESLEEKSKQSRSRVHYKKFTRGKDISKYSNIDLSCIVGVGKKVDEEEEVEEEVDRTGETENSHGVTTINSGSIAEYFKLKLGQKKAPFSEQINTDIGTTENSTESKCMEIGHSEDITTKGSEGENELKDAGNKSHKKKQKIRKIEDVCDFQFHQETEIIQKQCSNHSDPEQEKDDVLKINCNGDDSAVTHKKKKRRRDKDGCNADQAESMEDTLVSHKKEKKNKHKERDTSREEEIKEHNNPIDNNILYDEKSNIEYGDEEASVIRKKEKKSKHKERDTIAGDETIHNVINDEKSNTEYGDEEISVSRKKEKKGKHKERSTISEDETIHNVINDEKNNTDCRDHETNVSRKKDKKSKHKVRDTIVEDEIKENNQHIHNNLLNDEQINTKCEDKETPVSRKKEKKSKNKERYTIREEEIIEHNYTTHNNVPYDEKNNTDCGIEETSVIRRKEKKGKHKEKDIITEDEVKEHNYPINDNILHDKLSNTECGDDETSVYRKKEKKRKHKERDAIAENESDCRTNNVLDDEKNRNDARRKRKEEKRRLDDEITPSNQEEIFPLKLKKKKRKSDSNPNESSDPKKERKQIREEAVEEAVKEEEEHRQEKKNKKKAKKEKTENGIAHETNGDDSITRTAKEETESTDEEIGKILKNEAKEESKSFEEISKKFIGSNLASLQGYGTNRRSIHKVKKEKTENDIAHETIEDD